MPTNVLRNAAVVLIALSSAAALAPSEGPSPEELVALGDNFRTAGAHGRALALYEEALLYDSDYGPAWDGTAASLQALDEEVAVTYLAEARARLTAPLPPGARAVLAEGWARRGAEEKAAALLGNAKTAPGGRLSLLRGKINLGRGDIPKAIKHFKEARAAGEKTGGYYLGEALIVARRYDEAAIYLDEFLEDFPYVPDAHCARGEIFLAKMEYDRAAAAFVRALEFDPGDERALLDLAEIAAAAGDYGETIRLCSIVLKADPRQERAFRRAVEAYEHVDATVAHRKREEYERLFGE